MKRRTCDIVFFVLIALVLCIPIVNMNLLPDQVSVAENRSLAEFPRLSDGVTPFMEGIDAYVDDRIGFREESMQAYNWYNYKLLDGNHSQVIGGDEGWLFYHEELADYTGVNVSDDKTQRQVQILAAIDAWCRERDITFLFVVGPNKSTVYDQYMPDSVYHAPDSNLDHLLEALSQTDVKVYCPQQELLEHRDDRELYYRQDTHWNEYGSRYVMDAMIEDMGFAQYPFTISEYRESAGDLLNMQGMRDTAYSSVFVEIPFADGAYTTPIVQRDILLTSAGTEPFVCYRDSFTTALVEYYSYYFSGPMYWTYDIDFASVEAEQPRYLILSCVERYMDEAIAVNADVLTITDM